MLVVNLITRTLSSLAGIKLKRMNHRQRMLEVSKRVGGACVVAWWAAGERGEP